MPNIEIDFQVKNKKRIAVLGSLAIILLLYSVYSAFSSSETAPYSAPDNSIEHNSIHAEQVAPGQQAAEQGRGGSSSKLAAGDIFAVNPFIELKEFDVSKDNIADMAAAHNSGTVPAIPRSANIPLPVIPNHPMQPVQAGMQPVNNQMTADRIAVQGIATSDNGNNIAIMGDGRVVSEGDVYRDNRIAYIGGDGITFDNGTKVKYE
ncbi:hypothetical protein [Anaerovibrio sp.]|uniref:hypothetical protein n=1 Tax=Anaerovibrio sp. TaxID=1872532 RepID=UPI003F18DB4C